MKSCCPPGEGCNSPDTQELCALTALKRADDPKARHALELWERHRHASGSTRRFLRRAYTRARDRTLGLWTPWAGSPLAQRQPRRLQPR